MLAVKYTAKQIHDLRTVAYKLRYARREGYLTNEDAGGELERLSIESEVVTYMGKYPFDGGRLCPAWQADARVAPPARGAR